VRLFLYHKSQPKSGVGSVSLQLALFCIVNSALHILVEHGEYVCKERSMSTGMRTGECFSLLGIRHNKSTSLLVTLVLAMVEVDITFTEKNS
jgi:hypothetical protein